MAPLPQIVLEPGMSVRFEAIDPATGAAIAGVKVQAIALYGADASGGGDNLVAGPFMLVPGKNA
jgi:hypothetical protein